MASFPKKFNVASNPARKSSKATGQRKKGSTMAKAAKRRKAPNGGKHRKATRNPTRRRKARNPGVMSLIGSPKDLLVGGVSGLASALATRQLPQLILGEKNSSWQGYAANIGTALAASWAAGSFAGAAAGRGALIGGMVIVLDRVLSEQVSPISSYLSLSGVGDATAYSKLGTIRAGYYTHPNLQNPGGGMYVPDPITDQAVQAVVARYPQLAAPMAQAMSGGRVGAVNPSALRRHTANGMLLSSRFQGRFNQ
jgi:hypothetical protein